MEYKLIAKIIKPFGLKGEVKLETYTDFIEQRFRKNSKVYIEYNGIKTEFIILRYRFHKGQLLVTFKDYEDINLIEKYRDSLIYKNVEDIEPLKNDEYYFEDIIGLDIYDGDIRLGSVIDMEEGVVYNFMRVAKNDKTECLVPFIKAFVKEVDLENKRLYINNIEGLL